jgi:hypothetical protein
MEVCCDALHGWIVILLRKNQPLLASLVVLLGENQGNNLVDLHALTLFMSQVRICLELLLHTL